MTEEESRAILEFPYKAQTDLWLGEAYGVAWAGVERRVRERYPDLTGSAARAIAAHAAYQWK